MANLTGMDCSLDQRTQHGNHFEIVNSDAYANVIGFASDQNSKAAMMPQATSLT